MRRYFDSKLILFIVSFFLMNFYVDAQTPLKDEMRIPWADATGGFIRDWMVIGGFPAQNGMDTDFLQEHDGETKIKPEAGMTCKLQNGSVLEWKNYHSPYNYVNFFNALKDINYENITAYVFTKVNRLSGGKVVLSFGCTESNKIWVNGNLVHTAGYSGSIKENYQVEVDMVKGENSILMKTIHTGWTWGFVFRIIEPESFSIAQDFQLSPSILKSADKNKLTIQTDRTLNPELKKIDLQIKIVLSGGKIVTQKTVKRGEQTTFETGGWPNGVFDICFKGSDSRGEIITAYLYWYKGDAIKEAKELIASVPKNPVSQDELVHSMLADMIWDRLGKDLDKVDSSKIGSIYSPLLEYEELKLNNAGKKSSIHPNGFIRLAYRDETDNTPQFCRAYLPINYDPQKKWALVLNLHGYNGANPVYVKWWSVDSRHSGIADKYPVIYIEPHGRGNTSYKGMGERDVMRCVEMAKKLFNVDEDRIYLKGESMGGGGTWYVGTRHPDVFAAIAPVYGGWDYHVDMDEEHLAKLSVRERFNNEKNSSFAQADAMLTTPVFVSHGDADKSVDVKNSKYAVNMLQRWGYDIRYHEYPGYGHEGIDYSDQIISWFLEHKKNSNPEKVRVRAASLKSAFAHWVKVTQRENPFTFIEAEAEVLNNHTIRLSTENVLEIELSPKNPLIDQKNPVQVIWNMNDIREVKVENGKMILRNENYKPAQMNKNSIVEGPIPDVTNTPFAVVIGSISDDPLMVKLCNQKAQDFINYWKEWQKYEPRVFKDTDMTEDDLNKYSLILYGDARANLISKIMADKIPLKLSEQEIEIDGRKFPAKDACVQMVYPSPANPERYITVIGATSGAGMYFYNQRDEDCDFFIKDGCIPNGRLGRTIDKIYIAKGNFDFNWRINDKLLTTGDPELRKLSPVRKVLPDLTTTIDNLPPIDTTVYKTLVGKYEIQPGVNVTVYMEGNKLMAKGPSGPPLELYPASETEYFIDVVDIQLTFEKNESGAIEDVIIHENRDMKAKKIE